MIISLLGYMGTGKSVTGKVLANKLNYSYIDLDNYIEKKENQTIPEIFKEKGEVYFRKIEMKCLNEIVLEQKNIVLSLGGGTPSFGNNIEIIKNDTYAVYLKASVNELSKRLFSEKANRPLISHLKKEDQLKEFIAKHLFERNHYYEQAEFVLDTNNKTVDAIVEKIILQLF